MIRSVCLESSHWLLSGEWHGRGTSGDKSARRLLPLSRMSTLAKRMNPGLDQIMVVQMERSRLRDN